MNKITLQLLVFFCSVTILYGGEPEHRDPVPPFVAPVKEEAEWVLRIVSVQPSLPNTAPSSDVLKEIRLTKVGKLRRAILVATDESTMEFYHINGYHLSPTSASGQIMVSQELPQSEPYPFYSKGYYGVDWLKIEFYKGVVDYKKEKCFHYQSDASGSLAEGKEPEAGGHAPPGRAEAWIDCKTGLPMAVSIDGNLIEFVHLPASTQLTMSAAYDRAWKIQTDQLNKISAMKVVR